MFTPRGRSKLKYGNTPQTCRLGHSHRSKLESSVCATISIRERAGELKLIATEVHVYLSEARIAYIADFQCETPDGNPLYIEAKGYASSRWPIIKKLWKHYGPAPLEIWMGTAQRPTLDETIIPVTR